MNGAQMLVVLALLALLVDLYLGALGFDVTYIQALSGLAMAKAIALFLAPEQAPIVMMKSHKEIEEED